ncbi:velvet factor-domain-containing protein, partial [Obelidium mucronatum]
MPLTTLISAAATVEDLNSVEDSSKSKTDTVSTGDSQDTTQSSQTSSQSSRLKTEMSTTNPPHNHSHQTLPSHQELSAPAGSSSTAKILDLDPPFQTKPRSKHKLRVVQQPQRARVCGYSISDRRPIHPPPIVKIEGKYKGNTSTLVMFASLWSQDLQHDVSYSHKSHDGPSLEYTLIEEDGAVSPQQQQQPPSKKAKYNVQPSVGYTAKQVLMGQLVAVCSTLIDTDRDHGLFFVFHDLAVRSSGFYRLRFDLYEMSSSRKASTPLSMTHSNVFQVFSPKTFPGITETTDLSRCFARQGVKIRLRANDQVGSEEDGEDEII